ncbi:hypothetical protein FSOLCH5_001420 [Fusarium solani]|uniref:DNA-directed RNA polymerase II subunit RPB1 n=1 Tax=Fusarium solani TaxID=169388 RepID=A0A9P9L3T3_FUSSL|nr:uncharacterized protein B0J15DRAFT_477800 [Fusarium solani]KAH7273692.1 hypothetical protein B0J15DRAFT_477800 [Fusarium solani]KAI8688788.1 hypothetical protein NCS55_00133500 [Fusarium keratoplasticum]KAJ4237214.1 hypothetical protein NW759_000335 [Fusarium solani]
MNAHALLSSQGWRGTGHSLHKTDDSIGLAKPLLLNRKDNTQGLGQKQHFTSDQWWMNAFDEQLKGLDTSKKGKVVQTITTGKLNVIDKNLGKYSVYSSFVRGGFLEGTIDKLEIKDSSTDSSSDDTSDQQDTEKANGNKPRKETKEERRARKEAKRKRKEERALEKAARRERKSKSRKSSRSAKSSADSSDADEEKRRRRARKEEKRRQRAKEAAK